jgi:multidrug efflux system membrane fusion protein
MTWEPAIMHRKWLFFVPLLAVPVAGCQQSSATVMKPPPPSVEYQKPVPGRVTDFSEFPGQTDARITVQVRARVSGYMTRVYFQDGSQVHEGDKLFEIDPRPYKADYDRAVGTEQQMDAHLKRLEKEYNRAKNLLARQSISQEEHDLYEANYRETLASLEVAKANRALAQLNLLWTDIKAPATGLLSRRLVDPGNLIKADDTILTSIVTQDPMYVYFDVDEQNTLKVRRLLREGKIKAKTENEVPVQVGLSDEPDFPHVGLVDFTDNKVDVNTGSLRFRATISNKDGVFTPGLFVRVRLPIGDPHPTIFVREEALASDQGRRIVYVVVKEEDAKGGPAKFKIETKEVKIGSLRGGFRAVESGIGPDDWVVVTGLQRVRPGIEVIPKEKKNTGAAPKDIAFAFPPAKPAPAPRTEPEVPVIVRKDAH